MPKPDTIASKSKRTTVTVEMDDDGKTTIVVDRDGRRVHFHALEAEPVEK